MRKYTLYANTNQQFFCLLFALVMYLYYNVQLTSETKISYPLLVPDFAPQPFAGLYVPVNVSGLNQLHSFILNV